MKRLLIVVIGVAAIAIVAALLVSAFVTSRTEQAREVSGETPIAGPARIARNRDGTVVITLSREAEMRIGLSVEPLSVGRLGPEILASGALQEDPAETFVVRAPVPGTLHPSPAHEWPRVGAVLSDGSDVGVLEPRVAPATRVDLETRLAAARSDAATAAADLRTARAALERATALKAVGAVPARTVEEAQARVTSEQARLQAAEASVQVITSSLQASSGPTGPLPLRARRGGAVLEVLAQPGEVVEGGQPIVRLARFDRLVARVEVPASEPIDPRVGTATIVVLGYEQHPLHGHRLAQVASDSRTLGQTFLFRVEAHGLPLRPGQAITAYLTQPGAGRDGVVIPHRAVVRDAGQAWAYVEIGGERFARRAVPLDHPSPAGWLVFSGFSPGERVVVGGAQLLLSEELKSQTRIED